MGIGYIYILNVFHKKKGRKNVPFSEQNPFYSVGLSESPTIHAIATATMLLAVASGIPTVSCITTTTTLPRAVQNRRDLTSVLNLSAIL